LPLRRKANKSEKDAKITLDKRVEKDLSYLQQQSESDAMIFVKLI
jgi:hypothetical protein